MLIKSKKSNEKDVFYNVYSEDIKNIISNPITDGIIGLEKHKNQNEDNLILFCPPHFKVNLQGGERNPIFESFSYKDENVTFSKLYITKPSFFPLEMNSEIKFWNIVSDTCPNHIGIAYQILLLYRQDNWRDRLIEQYHDYLNGLENPSDSAIFRKIQKKVNDGIDRFLKFDYNHYPIQEFEDKINEIGFRYNIRIILYGGTKNERLLILKKINSKLNSISYMNNWHLDTFSIKSDFENIKSRAMDGVGKSHVLCLSELTPFIDFENTQIKSEIIEEVEEIIVSESTNPIELLPYGEELKDVDNKHIAERFIEALKDIKKINGNGLKLKNIQSGSTLAKMSFSIPKNIRFSDLIKRSTIEDIQSMIGVKHMQIKQGENKGEIDVILPLENRQKVFLRNYIDNNEFREFAKNNPLPFLIGVNEIGNPIYKCLNKARHILVAGTTGSGKSVWINQLILTLLMFKKPEELMFYMIDVKKVELPIYKNFPHVKSVITDADESIELLSRLISEMDNRYELFEKHGVKNIGSYNNKNPKNKLPYIVCVIDEYAELALRNKKVHDYIQTITQLSRASGIHLIIATQDPRKEVIPPIIKSNLPSKIGLRCSNVHSYMTFLNTKPPFNLLGNGDGVMSFEGQMEEHIRFQGCLIVDEDEGYSESDLIKDIAKNIKHNKIQMELPQLKTPIDDNSELSRLKRIIATTGETKVSNLRDIMKININRLNELMRELVDEGWLEKSNSRQQGYQLILGEEELNKWKDNAHV